MSGPGPPYSPLPAAVTRETINITSYPSFDGFIKEYLLDFTSHIVTIQSSTSMFGTDLNDRYSPTVQTLFERLEAGHQAPFIGLVQLNAAVTTRVKNSSGDFNSITGPAMQRGLEDFEDLYYALLAAVKSMHNTVITRLNNKFNYPDEPFSLTSGYTMHGFQDWLIQQWMLLNEPSLVLGLDNAIRRSLEEDLLLAHALLDQIGNSEMMEHKIKNANTPLPKLSGLELIGHEHPAMICGRLDEKYRSIFQVEKESKKGVNRRGKKFGKTKKSTKNASAQATREGSKPEHKMQQLQSGYLPTQWPIPLDERIQAHPKGSRVNEVQYQRDLAHAAIVSQDHSQRGYWSEAEEWQQMPQAAAVHHDPQHEHAPTYSFVKDSGTFAYAPLERDIALQQVASYTEWSRESASDDARRLFSWSNQPQRRPKFGDRNADVDHGGF